MKKIFLIIIGLLVFASAAGAANKISELAAARQKAYHPPAVKGVRLSNGMLCYIMEDHNLPIIQGRVIVRSGAVYEDLKKKGLASVTSALLKDGGTAAKTPEELRGFLDENAVDITFTPAPESLEGYFGSLSKDKDTALDIFFEMLFYPRFDAEGLAIVKKRLIGGLKRDMETPGPLVHRKFAELVYGKNSPWGSTPTPSSLKNITRRDIQAFYDNSFSPDRMILAVAGDFKREEILKKLSLLAEKYQNRNLPEAVIPPASSNEGPQTVLVSKKFTQSAMSLGHLGGTRDNPDKYALIMLNYILGGGGSFSNRLASAVRVKAGLAYEIWSAYSFGPPRAPALFEIHAKTRNETVEKALELIKGETARIRDTGVTPDEFKKAREGILNALVFEYERAFNIATAAARYVYFGYPENYLEIYKNGIGETTIKDVNEAAKRYLQPDKLKVVVVGKK